ncbi:MAG: pyridoxal 5'-phosphate synthase lyase subunit PdxS, partial [Chloroflexi bacterium]|nr:pyridoxal 5'-phosphate synthase lyase subunit PdxS [Chloroflexota bacterium]
VKAATQYDNPEILAEVTAGLGEPMRGTAVGEIPPEERLAVRGW